MTTQSSTRSRKIQWNGKILLLVLGIILIAMTLRTPLTVVGPIISFIRDGLNISNVLAGFLTTIPLLAFAVVSPFAPRTAKRFGIEWTLFLSIILLSIGIIIRSLGATEWLIIGTVLIGIAISFGNVLIPSFFKMKFPFHIGLLTGIYTVAMNISAGLGAGLSYPIAKNSGYGWQGALGMSIIIAILALIIWLPQVKSAKEKSITNQKNTAKITRKPLWRYPLTWAVTFAMGLQSFIFYTTGAWIPEIFIAQGMDADRAGWMVSVMQFAQIPMTFIMPIIAAKLSSQRPLVVIFTTFYIIGFMGLYLNWTSLAIVWMILLGFGGGASFSLVMMFFTLRTKTALDAADLSGFAQSIGYLLAAVGPVCFGFLHDLYNSWKLPLFIFIVITLLLFLSSMRAGKDELIE